MYALTVKQPWAQAIARYGKTVENRSRRPPSHLVGERIAIHVSRTLADVVGPLDDPNTKYRAEACAGYFQEHGVRVANAGGIIATARLVGYWAEPNLLAWDRESLTARADYEIVCACRRSPWFTGPVGWVLADVRALREPVGRPGWMCIAERCCAVEYGPMPERCPQCHARGGYLRRCDGHVRGQVFPFALSPEVEAAVLAAEVA